MDLGSIFSEDSNFTGISEEKPFYADGAEHSAVIDVDEQGTEAVAFTFSKFG